MLCEGVGKCKDGCVMRNDGMIGCIKGEVRGLLAF